MNITAFGNDGRLDIGIALDSLHFADPEHLLECLRDAFDSYLSAAGRGGAAPAKSGKTASTRTSSASARRERADSPPE